MLDFEGLLVELGAAPKKKPAAKKSPASKPKPVAKRAPAPKPKPVVKRAPAPKPRPVAKRAPAPKPKPVAKKVAAPKAKPKPVPKAAARPKAVPQVKAKAAPTPKRAAPAPRVAAQRLLAASGSASLALVPTSLQPAPASAGPALFAPAPPPPPPPAPDDYPPDDSEEYPAEESEETPEAEESEETDAPEESDESGEDTDPDIEWGQLQTTEAVELRPDVATSRLVDNIRHTAKPLAKHTRPRPMSDAEISRRANDTLRPACSCSGHSPESVRRRLNNRFIRRGYPAGTSDRLLAGVSLTNEQATKTAFSAPTSEGLAGEVQKKLTRLASKLPDSHPTKQRVVRTLLTAPTSTHLHPFNDAELGFVDAALGVAKGVGKVFKKIGSAVKKKKAKKKAKAKNKVIQMAPTDIVGQVPSDIIKGAAATLKAQGGAVTPNALTAQIASTVPPDVKAQVLSAIQENKAANLSKDQTIAAIAEQVDATVKPQVGAMLAALQAQQIQQQATQEHKSIVARDAFRNSTTTQLAALSNRLDEIAASHAQIAARLKMGNVAIVRKNLPIFGNKNALEG